MHAWIDVENPPQAQYLVPLARALERLGATVFVTARDYGMTFDLLRSQGVDFEPVGRHFGASKRAKVVGTLRRVRHLRRLLRERPRPQAVLSVSRSASLAARTLGIPSFSLCDYEYVNLAVFRRVGTYIIHPDVIPAETFRARGVPADRLIPFHGIKEDVTFADVDVESIPAHAFPELERAQELRVLVRPPAEESHYHREESSALGRETLRRLASDEGMRVIFSPRYEWQVRQLESMRWAVPPLVLRTPVPFVSLLKAVDVVISGGGTMTREAAYLGIPAVSVFRGAAGDVDRYLESAGRLTIVRSADDLDAVDLRALPRVEPMSTNPRAPDDIVDAMLQAIGIERPPTTLSNGRA